MQECIFTANIYSMSKLRIKQTSFTCMHTIYQTLSFILKKTCPFPLYSSFYVFYNKQMLRLLKSSNISINNCLCRSRISKYLNRNSTFKTTEIYMYLLFKYNTWTVKEKQMFYKPIVIYISFICLLKHHT